MGRGSSKVGGGGGGANISSQAIPAGKRSLSNSEIVAAQKQIDKTAFNKVGNGVWDFSGPYTIGAQILDETDSSAGGYGRMTTYSVKTWGQAVGDVSPTRYFGSLNAAKVAAKEEMKGWVPSVTVKQ